MLKVSKFMDICSYFLILAMNGLCCHRETKGPSAAEALLFYGGMETSPSGEAPFVRTLLCRRFSPPSLVSVALSSLSKYLQSNLIEHKGDRDITVERVIPGSLRDSLNILMLLNKYRKCVVSKQPLKTIHYFIINI